MAGVTEEVGKTAQGVVTAMGSQPVMLGMVLIVLALIGMLFVVLRFTQEARKNELELIFTQQREVQRLLATCVVPDDKRSKILGPTEAEKKKQAWRLQSEESHTVVMTADGQVVALPPIKPLPAQ